MRGIKQRIICVGAFFILTIFLLRFEGMDVLGQEITMRLSTNMPVNHYFTHNLEYFAKRVNEGTKGKVKIEVFSAGKLFSDKDLLRALPSGAVDMGQVFCPQWTGLIPLWIFLDLPLYFQDRSHWDRVMNSDVGEIMKQEAIDKGVGIKVLFWMHYGWAGFASKMPIRTLEDWKGKRIRGVGEIILEGIKALGASPVFLGGAEVYTALQRGTIDGANSGISSFWERKYYEVTKYITCPDFAYGTGVLLINKKKWDSLPTDVQKVIAEVSEEVRVKVRKECEKIDSESLTLLKDKGMDIYDPPEKEKNRWREACRPLQDYYIKKAGDKAKMILEKSDRLR